MGTAWLVLALGDERAHGGNDGYDDDPESHYSWDETVPNHGNLKKGDVIALWNARTLLGVSVIERVETGSAAKDRYTCPACGKADFKGRKKKKPTYLCNQCGLEFDTPKSRTETVRTYRSHHATGWQSMPGALSGAVLRSLCDSPKSQLSMRRMEWEKLKTAIEATTGAEAAVTVTEATRELIGGHRAGVVRVRVGQGAFRAAVLERHGNVCAFTGPAPKPALEAAHLDSFAATGEHNVGAALLLRRDVHRLFDMGLIAVNPRTLTIDLTADLHEFAAYAPLHGQPVLATLGKDHIQALSKHWDMHRDRP
ncbi:HNH endonuclease [Kitasatospora sp. NBC_00070]|uniref:HNH endonuclease n=1 Tax=Kitasatospora sp. NBC_00070 TaxID=2975962 RepID=UPI003252E030